MWPPYTDFQSANRATRRQIETQGGKSSHSRQINHQMKSSKQAFPPPPTSFGNFFFEIARAYPLPTPSNHFHAYHHPFVYRFCLKKMSAAEKSRQKTNKQTPLHPNNQMVPSLRPWTQKRNLCYYDRACHTKSTWSARAIRSMCPMCLWIRLSVALKSHTSDGNTWLTNVKCHHVRWSGDILLKTLYQDLKREDTTLVFGNVC